MANETTQRPTPGVVGVLNYLIDILNGQTEEAHTPIPKMSHGDSVLQCLNILYESALYARWLSSDDGQATRSEAEEAAVEQLGLDPEVDWTVEQQSMVDTLTDKLFLQRVPKFDLFSTTEEAVYYWMSRGVLSGGPGVPGSPR